MAANINAVLGTEVLLGLTGQYATELPVRSLPEKLLRGPTVRNVGSNTGYVLVGAGTNGTAKQSQRGSVARPVTVSGMSRRPEILLNSTNSIEIKADLLMNLTNPANGMMEQLAKSEIARQVRECTVLSMNLRTATVLSLFGLGKAWFDSSGNPLSSSSGAVVTVDPGIGANNLNQLNGAITASWATASTPIISNLQTVQKQALVNAKGRTGPIEYAIYGSAIFDYIYNNTQAQAYMSMFPAAQMAFMAGQIPQGFGGIKNWIPGNYGFYENSSGTTVTPIASDALIMFPEPDPSWYELQEGIQPVPTGGFGTAADLSSLAANIGIAPGMFTYAYGSLNPVGGTMVFGDNFLPAIHIPEVVFIADVVP